MHSALQAVQPRPLVPHLAPNGRIHPHEQMRVMIVDEDTRSSASLKLMLRDLGFLHTCAAYSGKRALALASEMSPTVVLLDLELPDMTGYHLAYMMRTHCEAHVRQLKLIAIAQHRAYAVGELARAAGFQGCLTKPVRHAALNGLLQFLQP
jgi:CheY-like chemotaxis protein